MTEPQPVPSETADRYEISTDPARLDLHRVHHWLSTDAYWALGRSLDTQRLAIQGSVNFGAYRDSEQVGYARLVTDLATFGWLCDVYVQAADRGHGLGVRLVAAACDHVRGYRLRRLLLATADAHGLYARFGFQPLAEPDRYLSLNLTI